MSDADFCRLEHTIIRANGETTVEVISSSWNSAPVVMLSGLDDRLIIERKPFGNYPDSIIRQEFRRV